MNEFCSKATQLANTQYVIKLQIYIFWFGSFWTQVGNSNWTFAPPNSRDCSSIQKDTKGSARVMTGWTATVILPTPRLHLLTALFLLSPSRRRPLWYNNDAWMIKRCTQFAKLVFLRWLSWGVLSFYFSSHTIIYARLYFRVKKGLQLIPVTRCWKGKSRHLGFVRLDGCALGTHVANTLLKSLWQSHHITYVAQAPAARPLAGEEIQGVVRHILDAGARYRAASSTDCERPLSLHVAIVAPNCPWMSFLGTCPLYLNCKWMYMI